MFEGASITLQQFNVLRILRGQHPNPISTSDIRERMLDRRSDVSRIVDRLVKKDLVVRRPCQNDKRLVDVLISKEGLSLLNSLDQQENEFQNIMGSLDQKEVEQLNELLDKLRSSVS
ncbi:MAG: MarR family transcriptional regulator [Bacteroidota bacterium]